MNTASSLEMVSRFRHAINARSKAVLVAVQDGHVICLIDVQRAAWEGMQHVGVLGMGVAASRRGQGVGRRLLQTALESATELGITRVELDVFASNVAAIGLYQAIGFVEEGRKRRARVL